jgi:hypothetical protein
LLVEMRVCDELAVTTSAQPENIFIYYRRTLYVVVFCIFATGRTDGSHLPGARAIAATRGGLGRSGRHQSVQGRQKYRSGRSQVGQRRPPHDPHPAQQAVAERGNQTAPAGRRAARPQRQWSTWLAQALRPVHAIPKCVLTPLHRHAAIQHGRKERKRWQQHAKHRRKFTEVAVIAIIRARVCACVCPHT